MKYCHKGIFGVFISLTVYCTVECHITVVCHVWHRRECVNQTNRGIFAKHIHVMHVYTTSKGIASNKLKVWRECKSTILHCRPIFIRIWQRIVFQQVFSSVVIFYIRIISCRPYILQWSCFKCTCMDFLDVTWDAYFIYCTTIEIKEVGWQFCYAFICGNFNFFCCLSKNVQCWQCHVFYMWECGIREIQSNKVDIIKCSIRQCLSTVFSTHSPCLTICVLIYLRCEIRMSVRINFCVIPWCKDILGFQSTWNLCILYIPI